MISIIAPAFNEEDGIEALHQRVSKAAGQWGDGGYELIIVDDGSHDHTLEVCEAIAAKDEHVKVVSLSRNFGHQPAVTAGLEHAGGEIIAIIDADLQDPPEVLLPMIEQVRNGYDVVYGIRTKRKEGPLKRLAYHIYYRMLRKLATLPIPLDAGDFCVMSRRVVDALEQLPERSRFVRGLRTWVGFRQTGFIYEREARCAGEPKYTFARLLRLALDGVINFSQRPLQLSMLLGSILGLLSLVVALVFLVQYVLNWTILGFNPREALGWTSLILVILLSSAVQLFCMGMLGEYVWRLFEESKRRPVYLVRRRINFSSSRKSHAEPHAPTEVKALKDVARWKSDQRQKMPIKLVAHTDSYTDGLITPSKKSSA